MLVEFIEEPRQGHTWVIIWNNFKIIKRYELEHKATKEDKEIIIKELEKELGTKIMEKRK